MSTMLSAAARLLPLACAAAITAGVWKKCPRYLLATALLLEFWIPAALAAGADGELVTTVLLALLTLALLFDRLRRRRDRT